MPEEEQYVIIKVDMPETVGNEANHDGTNAPSIRFGVNVNATQYASEYDSFDNQYDAKAGYSSVPVASVKVLGPQTVNGDLALANSFVFSTTESAEQAEQSPYRYWHADFVVTTDKPIAEDAITLAGQYDAWSENWVAFSNDGQFVGAIDTDDEIRLLKTVGDAMNITNPYINYEELCAGVKVFKCGLAANGDYNLTGTTVTVELRLYEVDQEDVNSGYSTNTETGKSILIGTYSHTF